MKILFSPSEEKNLIYQYREDSSFLDNLLFKNLRDFRANIIEEYLNTLKSSSTEQLSNLLGSKTISLDMLSACSNLLNASSVESIFLYNGVAFKALDIKSLKDSALSYLMENVIIFSNLFGAIRSCDKIPYYKLKQGESFGKYSLKYIYKHFRDELDSYLSNDLVLDLRAEVYIKAYSPNVPTKIVEFYKNGKKVSHYSKYYRGILLREIAINKKFVEPFKLLDKEQVGLREILRYEV